MKQNKGKILLPNGTLINATTAARELADLLDKVAPMSINGEKVDYYPMLTNQYLRGFQQYGTVTGGLNAMKLEYLRLIKLHKRQEKKQKLAKMKGLKKLCFKLFG